MKKPLFLTNRSFGLLFFGAFVSRVGDSFFNFAISWYILSLTQSAIQAGLFMAFGGVVFLLASPIGGVLVDRFDKVKVIYLTDIIRGVVVLISGIVIFLDVTVGMQLFILYFTSFVISILGALFNPASASIVPFVVGEEELQEANSYNQMLSSFVGIIGVALGGTLYSLLGVGMIFVINSLSYLLSGISEMFIETKTKPELEESTSLRSVVNDLLLGYRYIRGQKALMSIVLIGVFLNFFLSPIFTNGLPYLFNQMLKTSPIHLALTEMSFGFGSILIALLLSQKKQKEKISTDLKMGLSAFLPLLVFELIGIILVTNQVLSIGMFVALTTTIFLLFGGLNSFVNIPIHVILHKYVDKAMMGRVISLFVTLISGLTPLSVLLGGLIIERFGLVTLFAFSLVGYAFVVVFIVMNRVINEL